MTQAYAVGDIKTFKSVQHSSLVFFIIIALVFTFVLLVTIWFLPINKWLSIIEIAEEESKFVLFLLSFYMLWALPFRIIYSTYHSLGKLAKLQWIDNVQKIGYLLLVIILLIFTQDVILIASVQLLLMVIAFYYVLYDLKKNYNEVYPGFKFANKQEIKNLFIPGLFFVLYLFAGLFWMQGTIILISGFLGGLFVAMFSVSRTLSLLGRQVVDSFYYALFPDIASLFAKKINEKLKIIHKLLIFISFSIALIFSIIFWFYGVEIIYIWSIGKIIADETLLKLLLILITAQTVYIASASLLLASNNHKKFTLFYLAANFLGIMLSYLLISRFGINIIPISFMAGELLFCYFFVVKDTCKKIEEDIKSLLLSFLRFSIPLISIIFLLSYLINHLLLHQDIIIRLIIGISLTLVSSIFIVWYLFPAIEKRFLINKIIELRTV
jgi:O-antigen/teichoic acid export membrane protein